MSARNRHGVCAYCGKEKKLTKDHVPPKLLLEQPFPANLTTVPACLACNASFKEDDEYTRTMLALDVRARSNDAAQYNLPAILRSLDRPNAKGFATYLSDHFSDAVVLGADGQPAGKVFKRDLNRVNRTGIHLVTGLYYSLTGKSLPKHSDFRLFAKPDLTVKDDATLQYAKLYKFCEKRHEGTYGKAFSYAAAFGYGRSAWLMLLYDYFFWIAMIDERSEEERISEMKTTNPAGS